MNTSSDGFPSNQPPIPGGAPSPDSLPIPPHLQPHPLPTDVRAEVAPATEVVSVAVDALPLPPQLAPAPANPTPSQPDAVDPFAIKTAPSSVSITRGENDKPRHLTRKKNFMEKYGMLLSLISICLLTILVTVVGILRWQFPEWFAEDKGPPEVITIVKESKFERPSKFFTAGKSVAKVGGVRISIERVEKGAVLASTNTNQIQATEGDQYIQIHLRLKNDSDIDVDYSSWYGNLFTIGKTEVAARLFDDKNIEYPMMVFEDAKAVHGTTESAYLQKRQSAMDSIVFEIPEEAQSRKPKYYRLELPNAAIKVPGSIGFEIPAEMLDKKIPKLGGTENVTVEPLKMDDDKMKKK